MDGTQSPPLENTGPVNPLGKTDRQGGVSEGVKDSEQRKGYFRDGSAEQNNRSSPAAGSIERAAEVARESVSKWNAKQKEREDGMMRY